MTAATDAWHATAATSCRRVKPSVFNRARVASASAHGGGQGEAEGNNGTDRKSRCQHRWGETDGAISHDLSGTLDTDDGDVIALRSTAGKVGEDVVGCGGDALQVGVASGRGDAGA